MQKCDFIAIISTMRKAFLSLSILLFLPLSSEELQSDFSKNHLFSVFGYSPLMSAEEKELRNLHASASTHVKRKEYCQAEKAFESILARIDPPFLTTSKYKIDWTTYIDLILRLAETKYSLKEYKDGEHLLLKLIEAHPPEEYLPGVYLLLARYKAIQNDQPSSYLTMLKASQILALEKWKGEDRSFFHSIEYLLDDYFDKSLKKARRFAIADNTSDAIKIYEEVQLAITKGHFPLASKDPIIAKKVRYRLAELYSTQACYEKTLDLVDTKVQAVDAIDSKMLYLRASAYKEKREFEKAVMCFQEYLETDVPKDPAHYFGALLEIGLNHYRRGKYLEAKNTLEKIQTETGKVQVVARLYLAKIHLKEENPELAKKLLLPLVQKLNKDEPLRFEISYLMGQAHFQMGDFANAIAFFETANGPGQNQKEWSECALYKLGLCYLKLGEKEAKYQATAEKIFEQLSAKSNCEKIIISLARLYRLQNQDQKLEAHLAKMRSFLTKDGYLEAHLLLAEVKKTYREREEIYRELSQESFSRCLLYPECWYDRGVNEFKEGNFSEAIFAFEKAFSLYEKIDGQMACHILQCDAIANFYQKLPLVALKQLENLLGQVQPGQQEEVLYLRGLVATHLASHSGLSEKESLEYSNIAFESLSGISKKGCTWAPQALFALGAHHFRKKQFHEAARKFKELCEVVPASPIASHALFWWAEAEEKLGSEWSNIAALRKKCYEQYPFSLPAPLAYLKCFPFESYQAGQESALAHINCFSSFFPHSPLTTIAYYFSALHEKENTKAISVFQKALHAYDLLGTSAKENRDLLLYFRTKSVFEIGLRRANEESGNEVVEKTIALLEGVLEDLRKNEILKSPLEDEGLYVLAKLYVESNQEKKAAEILQSMLDRYHNAGTHEGYYLSLCFMEQGKLALKHKDEKSASLCFEMATTCGQGYLLPEDQLNLWLYQSECLKRENKLDSSMKMLSKVINQDTPSQLKEKAMFLRAEIYELTGREELAIRQLEATAKRGGTWGKKAKDRLDHLRKSL